MPNQNFGNVKIFSEITNSALCPFDVDSATPGQQFKLIFTPYTPGPFKLAASNPGQFYDNVFLTGDPGVSVSITISVPYPFVTQGAVPVHVYSGSTTNSGGCILPGTDVTNSFTISGTPITLTGYGASPVLGTTTETITVTGTVPSSGQLYINVHLDYGFKASNGYQKSLGGLDALCGTMLGHTCTTNIPNLTEYEFGLGLGLASEEQTVQNVNVFKNDPGFAGLVTDQSGNPLSNAKVVIKDAAGKMVATVYTDSDGWYMYTFKYSGSSEVAFTITASSGSLTKTTQTYLQPKSVVEIDFVLS